MQKALKNTEIPSLLEWYIRPTSQKEPQYYSLGKSQCQFYK